MKANTEFNQVQINFKEFELDNKLHCILHKNNLNPIVNVVVGYDVGSKDEKKNKRGVAHLFEHLMFQGSENVKKNEHFEYIMKAGGTCNAFTMQDATVYYDSLPSNNLELGLWLEADRMNSLDLSEENLLNQKKVVSEEKLQRCDNTPYGTLYQNVFKNVCKGSNYEWDTIGEIEDINSFSGNEAKEFHSNFYSPDNSVLIVSGDIDYDETEKLIQKYFSGINKKNMILREPNLIKHLDKNTEVTVYDNIQLEALITCYLIPGIGSDEDYILDYFADIFANKKSSRLYKKLVYGKQILKSVSVLNYTLKDCGVLLIKAMLNPGADIDLVRKEIETELENFITNGISDEEFLKVRNQIEFESIHKISKIMNISIDTAFNYIYFKDTSIINSQTARYLSFTKDDVIDSVKNYIADSNKFVLKYLPHN